MILSPSPPCIHALPRRGGFFPGLDFPFCHYQRQGFHPAMHAYGKLDWTGRGKGRGFPSLKPGDAERSSLPRRGWNQPELLMP